MNDSITIGFDYRADSLEKGRNKDFDVKSARAEGVLELKKLEKDDRKESRSAYRKLCYINSSLALELSESLKPSKKNGESPLFLCVAK